ncbi:hypothetical protein B0T19DRAFT_405919 [Cercophora scortea]|uniref:GST N-terminal domain-containing protein n=1 Tax=Cercophora scortea TaxID=314031 RepID=A0AAE0MKQ5_9PEZI|nr:hypothetical protein B0T19DRAFT_405919 [Cercophora scortea]
MTTEPIVFFDLPTRAPVKAWSLNPWRTRFVLNYKGLNYKTEWVEYPDIKARLEGHVTPNASDPPYTIPAIRLPDGKYVMDSYKIADELEKQHPSPPLHLGAPVQLRLVELLKRVHPPFFGIVSTGVPKNLLSAASIPYWYRTRGEDVGMPLDEYTRLKGGEVALAAMAPHMRAITDLLKETPDGPFFMGKEVSYTDFIWAGFLIFVRNVDAEAFERALELSGDGQVHRDFLEALKPWSERDDH